MYKIAEERINKGLGLIPRLLLGFCAILFGVIMMATASSTKAPFFSVSIGIFFIIIAVACFTKGRIRQVAGSIIGLALFFMASAYIYSQISSGPVVSDSRSEPSVINSICFMIFFGIPGLVYSIKARFGFKNKKARP